MQFRQKKINLSQSNTNCLKGILALCVLMCHLWANVSADASFGLVGRVFGVAFTAVGYLSVSLFFFLSGYGLMVQYKKRGNAYLDVFLRIRVFPLYVLCVILIIFYSGVRIIFGETISTTDFVQSFFFGATVISKGWYLQSILLWYILFFLSFRFSSERKWQITGLICSFVVYVSLCLSMGLTSTWYEACICLPLGVFWAMFQEKIDSYLSRRYFVVLISALLCFVVLFVMGNSDFLTFYFLKITSKSASAVAFVIAAILLLRIIPIDNFITRFLGRIYFEIYVIHGFVLMLWHNKYIYLSNKLIYTVAVLISSILLACVVKPLFRKILQLGKGKQYV